MSLVFLSVPQGVQDTTLLGSSVTFLAPIFKGVTDRVKKKNNIKKLNEKATVVK